MIAGDYDDNGRLPITILTIVDARAKTEEPTVVLNANKHTNTEKAWDY